MSKWKTTCFEKVPWFVAVESTKYLEGMNSTMIYCKNFYKCHNVSLVHNKILKNFFKSAKDIQYYFYLSVKLIVSSSNKYQ
jgi:hypothetical protein